MRNDLESKDRKLVFSISHHGEEGAGIRPYTGTVTVLCESGDPGGEDFEWKEYMHECIEWKEYMHECISTWFDGASVELI